MGQVSRLAAKVVGDPTTCHVARGDGGQHRMVERDVVEVGLLSEQIATLAKERAGGVEHRTNDPRVEIVGAARSVTLSEFAAVGRGATNNSMSEHGGPQVDDPPKPGGKAEIQRRHDKLQSRPPTQRSGTGKQPPHERQGRATQQQTHRSITGPRGRVKGTLNNRRQRGRGFDKKRKLIDDDGQRPTRSDAHELTNSLIPPGEAKRHRFVAVTGKSLTELPERIGFGSLGSSEHEAAVGASDRIEQERLALTSPPGDHTQGGFRTRILSEANQLSPLEVAVKHINRLVHDIPASTGKLRLL